eukprot:5581727-Amphidinium_carterae.1
MFLRPWDWGGVGVDPRFYKQIQRKKIHFPPESCQGGSMGCEVWWCSGAEAWKKATESPNHSLGILSSKEGSM